MGQELLHFGEFISVSVENYLKLVFQKTVNVEMGDNLWIH
jgi:hypothetical protein